MEFYTYCQTLGNSILYRGYKNGRQVIDKVDFGPTLFVPTKKRDSKSWFNLYDSSPLEPINFSSIRDAKEYLETYKDVHGMEIHGMLKWNLQYINSKYPSEIEYDLSQVKIHTIDIETVDENSDDGFPDIQAALIPIVLISIYDSITNETIVLGLKDFEKQDGDNFTYKKFSTEKDLLKYFIEYQVATKPDIWTGWNTSGFDIPYIINRIVRLFDENTVKRLSPFNFIKEKTFYIRGKEVQSYEIYGIVDLDYLALYKKFGTYSAKESYTLGFISQEELGETKLDLPGSSFRDSYINHFNTFVRYNAIDSILVKKLESKLKLIELAFAMAYMYHCNLSDVFRTVAPWEAFIYTHLSSKKIAVPPRTGGLRGDVEGAWVKDGIPGMYGWCMSFDFSSLYPSIIRQWNISPETFKAAQFATRTNNFIKCDEHAKAAIAYAKENNYTLAANGTMYDKSKKGFLAELMEYCMEGRKKAKKEMLKYEALYQKTHDDTLLPKIAAFHNKQMALKIAANSCYGAIGNDGFHYYDYRMAEAITLTGQLSDIHLANLLNSKFNKILKTENVDYIIAGDTDSVYINCQDIVDKFNPNCSVDSTVKFLDSFAEKVCQPIINESVSTIFNDMNAYDRVMASKREAIASKMLYRAKKNYAMYVYNSEGVAYTPPKLKVMGIEIVRSSTPKWCREKLKYLLKLMFESDEKTLRMKFMEVKKEFKTCSPEDIAFPRGVSDIDKYFSNGIIKSGLAVPIHVRAAYLFNKHTAKYKKYQQIQNGDKIKYLYLKLPNPIKQNVIGFPANIALPPELGLNNYIDYDTQFEKTVENVMKSLTDCAGWKLREESSLEGFFD